MKMKDNQSAIYFSSNNKDNAMTKHIDVIYHFVREQLVAGLITILKIPSTTSTVNTLTKPLPAEARRHMSSPLVNIYSEDEGC